MIRQLSPVLFFILITPSVIYGQDNGSGLDYQLTMFSNPGLTGAEGNGYLRLSYLNFYPGNNYNLHTLNLSYDSYFPGLHGGAGFFLINDYLGGIVNNFTGGFSYAYSFQAGSNLFISAGLSASVFHRSFNFNGALLPDQIDPVMGAILPSYETLNSRGKSVLDLGTGFLFVSGRFFWGISVAHLTEPDPDGSDSSDGILNRKLLLHLAGDFDLGKERYLKIRPIIKFDLQKGYMSSGAGAVIESKHLSISSIFLYNDQKDFDLQSGFSISTGSIIFYYNYRFNIVSGNNLLPLSLFHNTGIAVSLNNVEKRKTVKTINFPKL